MRDCDLQAPWVGKCAEDYYGEDEEEIDYDEDFEYESQRDMELMEEEE